MTPPSSSTKQEAESTLEEIPVNLGDREEHIQTPSWRKRLRFRKINLKKFNYQLKLTISIGLKLLAVAGALLLIFMLVREVGFDGYVLEEVRVPENFEKAGITGNAIAAQITAHIDGIKEKIRNDPMNNWDLTDAETVKYYLLERSSTEVEVNLAGVELSMESIAGLISNSLGISRAKKINIYITSTGGVAKASIYIENEMPLSFAVNVDSIGLLESSELIANSAAESVLKIGNTEMLACYYSFSDRTLKNLDKVIELASFGLSHGTDTSRNKYFEHMWAWALNDKGRFTEGFEMAKKAIAHGGAFVSAYTTAGDALKESKQYVRSRQYFRQALAIAAELQAERSNFLQMNCYRRILETYRMQQKHDSSYKAPDDTVSIDQKNYIRTASKTKSTFELARALDEIAFYFSESAKYDSALVYARKAIATDSSYAYPYFTIAEVYAHQKEHERFYEFLEKAFAKGFCNRCRQADLVDFPHPASRYINEDRFKRIWRQYVK